MNAMRKRGIADVLTHDTHFTQEGFSHPAVTAGEVKWYSPSRLNLGPLLEVNVNARNQNRASRRLCVQPTIPRRNFSNGHDFLRNIYSTCRLSIFDEVTRILVRISSNCFRNSDGRYRKMTRSESSKDVRVRNNA